MFSVIFSARVELALERYIDAYRRSFRETYTDTGIWSESIILDRYEEETKTRKNDIIAAISERFSGESVIGHSGQGTVVIHWKSKYLFVEFREDREGAVRFVENLEIR